MYFREFVIWLLGRELRSEKNGDNQMMFVQQRGCFLCNTLRLSLI